MKTWIACNLPYIGHRLSSVRAASGSGQEFWKQNPTKGAWFCRAMPMQDHPLSTGWSWEAGGLCHLWLPVLEKWKDAGRAPSPAGLWLRALGKRDRARAAHHSEWSRSSLVLPHAAWCSPGDGMGSLGLLETLSLLKRPCMFCDTVCELALKPAVLYPAG